MFIPLTTQTYFSSSLFVNFFPLSKTFDCVESCFLYQMVLQHSDRLSFAGIVSFFVFLVMITLQVTLNPVMFFHTSCRDYYRKFEHSCPILSNRFHPDKTTFYLLSIGKLHSLAISGQSAVDSIDSFHLSNGKVYYRFDKCGRRSDNRISSETTATRCKIVESIDSFDWWEWLFHSRFVYVIAWGRGQLRINFTSIFKVFTKLSESRSDEGNLENFENTSEINP